MTRKRFCKLMMARGYSRNSTQRIAEHAGSSMSYEFIYQMASGVYFNAFMRAVRAIKQALVDALTCVVNAFLVAMPEIVSCVNAVARTLNESLAPKTEGVENGGD